MAKQRLFLTKIDRWMSLAKSPSIWRAISRRSAMSADRRKTRWPRPLAAALDHRQSGIGRRQSFAGRVKVAGTLGVPIDELFGSPRARVRKWSADDIAAQHPAAASPCARWDHDRA
jgi:hypothetical protein